MKNVQELGACSVSTNIRQDEDHIKTSTILASEKPTYHQKPIRSLTSFIQALDSINSQIKKIPSTADCSTQSVPRALSINSHEDILKGYDVQQLSNSSSQEKKKILHESFSNVSRRSSCTNSNRHSDGKCDEDALELICHKQGARAMMRYPRKHSVHVATSPQLMNQACGPDHSTVLSSKAVGSSFTNLIDLNGGTSIPAKDVGQIHNCVHQELSETIDDEVIKGVNTCEPFPSKPLLVFTASDKDIKAHLEGAADNEGSARSIDMQNHLFVRYPSGTSLASSVYIGDDGKAIVINEGETPAHRSASSVSQSRQAQADGPRHTTGAVPKRDTSARPKTERRGEPLGLRKKVTVTHDDRERSSGLEDPLVYGARGHRIVERNRTRVRNQHSRKNHFGIKKEPHRSPGRWAEWADSSERRKRFTDNRCCSRQPGVEKTTDDLRRIWVNPDTDKSSSDSNLDVDVQLSRTFVIPAPSKTSSPRELKSRPRSAAKTSKRAGFQFGKATDINLSTFECVVCKDYLQPPLRMCDDGHGVCTTCLGQGDSCPICHTTILSEPNKILESLIRAIPFPCKNSSAGCRETYWIDDHKRHGAQCLYRPRTCPFANQSSVCCTWKGIRSGIRAHLTKCHEHDGVVHPLRTFFPAENFDVRLWVGRTSVEVVFVESEIFEFHKVFDAGRSCVLGFMRHILARDVTAKFCYTVRFRPENIKASVSFNNEVVGGPEKLDHALGKGKSFKFYLDSFTEVPLTVFSIQLKVVPKSAASLFHGFV